MPLDKALLDKYTKDSIALLQKTLLQEGIPIVIPVDEKGQPSENFRKAFEQMGEQYLEFARFQFNF